MARFDVYRNHGRHQASVPYLLDVQSNHLGALATRVVIPLRQLDRFPNVAMPADITPDLVIEGVACFLDTPQLAAIPAVELKHCVMSVVTHQTKICAALDRLFGGF